MRFKTYIIEMEKNLSIEETDIKKIKKDCKIFINWQKTLHHPLPIYRGKSGLPNAINILTRRKNTRPIVNRLLDGMLQEKFYWKPRSQGVFTCGKMETVSGYGVPNIFLPIGNYRYVWSNVYYDLFLSSPMSDINSSLLDRSTGEYKWKHKGAREEARNILKRIIDTCIDYDLEKAILSGHEIMFDCNRYYLISDTQTHKNFDGKNDLRRLFERIVE